MSVRSFAGGKIAPGGRRREMGARSPDFSGGRDHAHAFPLVAAKFGKDGSHAEAAEVAEEKRSVLCFPCCLCVRTCSWG